MKYISRLFQPLITIPKNAKIKNTEITCKSQKLLLECGLIRPTSSGIFSILPLAQRSLEKLTDLIRRHIEGAGAQRLALPTLTAASLWEKTGRLDSGGDELMNVQDRHGKKYLLAPTHEEAIADLLADISPLSYKQLPLVLYQITSKYRDERRPKHGLLRAREFLMLDAYAAHVDGQGHAHVYERLTDAYKQIFDTLQLPVYKVSAPTGEMGGSLSHEWQLRASAGEDQIAVCPSCLHASLATNETVVCDKCGKEMDVSNSIEVGHTFILGTKYSEPLKANYVPATGPGRPLHMSCYGIGITRLLAAGLEALSSEQSLRWPRTLAPYSIVVIGPKEGSKEWSHHGWDSVQRVCRTLAAVPGFNNDILVDDRHTMTIGKRLMMADRMGYPYILVCGKSTLDPTPKYELYTSRPDQESKPELLTLEEVTEILSRESDVLQKNEFERIKL